MTLLKPDSFKHYIDRFNATDPQGAAHLISNKQSWQWIEQNVPLFSCPDRAIEQAYYLRWWNFRKPISRSTAGHHLMEGRWLRDTALLDGYTSDWFRANVSRPEDRFQCPGHWMCDAIFERFTVTGQNAIIAELFDDMVKDFEAWEAQRKLPDGMYFQTDTGNVSDLPLNTSRLQKYRSPAINSYMFGNAQALMFFAALLGKKDQAIHFRALARDLKWLVQEMLWDRQANFFKVRGEDGELCEAREASGFIPWSFLLPDAGFEEAWAHLSIERDVFPPDRPSQTSQTLTAMGNLLRHCNQTFVTRQHYLDALRTNPNVSAFADLVIGGLVGVCPLAEEAIIVDPLLPENSWDWFCLERVPYHGHEITIVWDRDGAKFKYGKGLSVIAGEQRIAHSPQLSRVTGELA